jgi:hypothetical protein
MGRQIWRAYTIPALVVTGLLLLISVSWWLWRQYEVRQLANLASNADVGASGRQFLLQVPASPLPQRRRAVEASIHVWPTEVTPGDSVSVVLRLDSISAPECTAPTPKPDSCQLGEEGDGLLASTLIAAADCQVTPQKTRQVDTSQDVTAFVWVWTVDCKTAGIKALQFGLDLQAKSTTNDSAPLNFRQLAYFRVADPLLPRILAALTTLAGIVSVVSGVVANFVPNRAGDGPSGA